MKVSDEQFVDEINKAFVRKIENNTKVLFYFEFKFYLDFRCL